MITIFKIRTPDAMILELTGKFESIPYAGAYLDITDNGDTATFECYGMPRGFMARLETLCAAMDTEPENPQHATAHDLADFLATYFELTI